MLPDLVLTPGSLIAGKYRVDGVLGEGGMGVVVAAQHLELDRKVAIKFLLPAVAQQGDAAERFRREARAAAKIQSEHVCRVLDVGTLEHGVPYMVMEHLEGQDLSQALGAGMRFAIPESVSFILEAIEAVSLAHAAGIVHRDLKPANLYLADRGDGSRRVKVLDFGISKSMSSSGTGQELSLTASRSIIGSPLYMCPEQMMSARDVDTRADIWALGAILYELLTGRPPYEAETLPQLCKALLTDVPPPPRQLRPDLPEALEAAVMRCLEKDREKRWATVGELFVALAPFAPQSGGVHADRARKLVNSSVGSALGDAALMESPTLVGVGPAPITAPLAPSPIAANTAAGTLASWEKTSRTRRSALAPLLIAAGVLGTLAIGYGLIKFTSHAEPAAEAAVSRAPAAHPQEVKPAAAPTPPPAPGASSVLSAVSAAPVPSEPPPPVPSSTASTIASAKTRPLPKKPASSKAAAPSAKQDTSSGISDFGGRR
ncbi:MAG: serine/threonine-protein kinase [Polyangiaceae bacterium]|nr:serine/threonine-protein kinase [Polyangiaceae bacterium]